MRLTTHTDYALRVLIYLALRTDQLATISEVACSYRISKTHLMKVVHQLGLSGYVGTVRGRGGGIRLKKRPAEILIGDVVRCTEPDLGLVECFRTPHSCAIESSCALSRILSQALNAFLDVLDQHTLADLVGKPAPLTRLLDLADRAAADTGDRLGRS